MFGLELTRLLLFTRGTVPTETRLKVKSQNLLYLLDFGKNMRGG